jgi:hypothetical protein
MKTKLFILAVTMVFISCATTSLSTKVTKYYIISSNARGFNRYNKTVSYDAIIKIDKVYYNAILNESLGIEKIGTPVENIKLSENLLAN